MRNKLAKFASILSLYASVSMAPLDLGREIEISVIGDSGKNISVYNESPYPFNLGITMIKPHQPTNVECFIQNTDIMTQKFPEYAKTIEARGIVTCTITVAKLLSLGVVVQIIDKYTMEPKSQFPLTKDNALDIFPRLN